MPIMNAKCNSLQDGKLLRKLLDNCMNDMCSEALDWNLNVLEFAKSTFPMIQERNSSARLRKLSEIQGKSVNERIDVEVLCRCPAITVGGGIFDPAQSSSLLE